MVLVDVSILDEQDDWQVRHVTGGEYTAEYNASNATWAYKRYGTPATDFTGNRVFYLFRGITIPQNSLILDATLIIPQVERNGTLDVPFTIRVVNNSAPTKVSDYQGATGTGPAFNTPVLTPVTTFTANTGTATDYPVDVKDHVQALVNAFDYSNDNMLFRMAKKFNATTTQAFDAQNFEYQVNPPATSANLTINYSVCASNFCEDFNEYALSKLPDTIEKFNLFTSQTLADASWVTTDTAKLRANAVTEVADFDPSIGVLQDEKMAFDLVTPVSDEKWTLRCVIDHTNITIGGDTTSTDLYIGLADNASTGWDIDQNFIGCALRISNGLSKREWRASFSEGSSSAPNQGGLTQNFGGDVFTSDIDGIEIKRISSSLLRVTRFNQDFTTVLGSVDLDMSLFTVGVPTGLQFIKLGTFNSDGTGNSTNTGTIDNIEIWNSPKQQGDVTFQDDFALKTARFTDNFSVNNWTTSNATFINVSGGVNNFDLPTLTTVNDASIVDLGAGNVSDTSWVLRAKLSVTTFVTNTDLTGQEIHVGISDSDQTVLSNAVQDYIGLKFSGANNVDTFDVVGANGVAPTTGGAIIDVFTRVPTVETIFIEIIRNSATEVTINQYSDATFTTLLESAGGIISAGITGLRFIKIMAKNSDGTANGDITGSIDDLEFYNGESTLTRWNNDGEIFVDTTNKVIVATDDSDGTYNSIRKDLVSVSDTNWSLRWKHTFDTITTRTTDPVRLYVGLFDNIGDDDVIQDAITILFDEGPSFTVNLRPSNGVDLEQSPSIATFTDVPTQGETRFYELKRTSSTTIEALVYSDVNYRNLIERISGTISAGIIGTQFLMVKSGNRTDATGVVKALIDDIEFYNGVSVPRTPLSVTKDFEDTFSADNFTDVGTGVVVNTSTEKMDFTSGNLNAENGSFIDLGLANVSDTEWTLRFKFRFSTLTDGAPSANLFVGMSDDNVNMGGTGNQDFIGLNVVFQNVNKNMFVQDADNSQVIAGAGDIDFTTTPVINTDYYVEVARTSDTTYVAKLYSDPDFSILIASGAGTCPSTIVGLRFIKVAERSAVGGADMTGTVDDIQFWNKQRALDHQNKWRKVDL